VSVSHSGIAIIALQGSATFMALLAGRTMVRIRHYKRMPLASLAVAILALLALAARPTDLPVGVVVVLIAVIGCGVGPMFPTTIVAIQNAVELHQLGIATGLISFSRSLGGSLIVTVFTAIVLTDVPSGSLLAIEELTAKHSGALGGMAFRWVFVAAAVCLLGAFGCVLTIEERPLRGAGER
jgi:MFS family permease